MLREHVNISQEYIIFLYFITTIVFWDQFPIIITYHFSAFICLTFVFNLKKSLFLFGIIFFSIPINYAVRYYFPDVLDLKKTEMFNLFTFRDNLNKTSSIKGTIKIIK